MTEGEQTWALDLRSAALYIGDTYHRVTHMIGFKGEDVEPGEDTFVRYIVAETEDENDLIIDLFTLSKATIH